MQSPPFPRYLVPPRSKYSPQHPVLKHPHLTFLPQCQRPSFTPIQTTGKITVLYILIFKFLDSNLEDKRFCTEWYQVLPDLKVPDIHFSISLCWLYYILRDCRNLRSSGYNALKRMAIVWGNSGTLDLKAQLILCFFFNMCSTVHRNSRLKKSNKMQLYADIYLLLNYSTCFGRTRGCKLQFYVLLMMGAVGARNM